MPPFVFVVCYIRPQLCCERLAGPAYPFNPVRPNVYPIISLAGGKWNSHLVTSGVAIW